MKNIDTIYNQDCLDFLKNQKSNSVNLIMTSPPYADQRKKTYGGIPVSDYVNWFLPISLELKRVLTPSGSFILNIKEKAIDGERATYVLELILEMKKQGWLWVEEYIWHKKNSFPGKWPNRFRDSWERCLHFTKQKKFDMYQKEVMVPMGEWANSRIKNPSKNDNVRHESQVKSGLGRNVSNWSEREMAYPTNVLHMATECGNVNHSAAFPISLPSWFIKLFTKRGDVILDPFMGSGTTALAALSLQRHFLGTEKNEEYYEISLERIKSIGRYSQKKSKILKSKSSQTKLSEETFM
jgi:site-specific DNA-methyltransferase (adenine-specific)